MSDMQRWLRALRGPMSLLVGVMLFSIGSMVSAHAQGEQLQDFSLKEYVGQEWTHDLVFFPLKRPLSALEQQRVMLLNPAGESVPYQFYGEGEHARIAFLADLPQYGTATYRLVWGTPQDRPAPMVIERMPQVIRVSNGITGVAVPTPAGRYQDGPLQGIRMKSGAWVGGSRLTTGRAIEGYDAKISAEGPVFVELECRYRFAGEKTWVLRLRVISGEPVVLIDETFDLGDTSRWEFLAHQGLSPTHVFMRLSERGPYTMLPLKYQDNSVQVQLCPWIPWWDIRNTAYFGLCRAPKGVTYTRDAAQQRLVRDTSQAQGPDAEKSATPGTNGIDDDMLIAAAGNVESWAVPASNGWEKFVPVRASANGDLAMQLQLASPGRHWLLGTTSVTASLVKDDQVAPAHRLMNRFCETPLNAVKDMPLSWTRKVEFPRLVMKRDEIAQLVASPTFAQTLANNPRTREIKSVLLPLIARRDAPAPPAQVDAIKRDLDQKLQNMVSQFRYGNAGLPNAALGTFIPRLDIGYVLPPMDLALGAGIYTPEEEERIFAQLAFVADKIYSPSYVNPGRGYAGNPNMVTSWSASLVLLACMMPEHPHAKAWYEEGMRRLDNMLETWQDANGGWLEAPHYQIVALDAIFLAKKAAANSGYLKGNLDERLLRTIMFLAKISTPPDPRFASLRHIPPLGNTYLMETSLLFGATAKLYRTAEPEKASALQWVWRQQGKPSWYALGGAFMLDFYLDMLADESWDPPAPAWSSELFPGFGAVLRSGFPGERETYMVYHQGEVATQHYDYDQGSFELWAKGRPLSLDWGYNKRMPAWLHNCMDVGQTGKIQEFSVLPSGDYLHGRQAEWDRQILFVKDKDPMGPTYFVLRDTVAGKGMANWWLWVNARKDPERPAIPPMRYDLFERTLDRQALPPALQITGEAMHVTGEHDVDLMIWFAPPAQARLAELTVKQAVVPTVTGFVGGGNSNWDGGKTEQYGLQLAQPRGEPLMTVLYPHLRTETAPQISTLAGGKVVKIVHALGVDYAFLALEPFEFADGPVQFKGIAGAIQVRGKQLTLTLSTGGEIRYGRERLTSTAPQAKVFTHD